MKDADDADTFSLIRQAILFENIDLLLDLLTECPSNRTLRDSSGRTPLMLAAHNGRMKALEMIIHLCPETIDLSSPQTGKTALHLCCEAGESATAAILLSAGADPSPLDKNGYCALEIAHIAGHSTVASLLIDAIQAEIRRVQSLHLILLEAAKEGNVEQIQDILKMKTNKEILVNGNDGKGVLLTACQAGRPEVVSLLLTSSNKTVHNLIDSSSGDSILHFAISSQNICVVRTVLENFPTLVSRANNEGSTPLHWAVLSTNVDIVELLLDFPYPQYSLINIESHTGNYIFSFDVNAVDSECRTALYLAVLQSLSDILSSLLSMCIRMSDGSNRCPFLVDVYCKRGRTPLMIASFNRNLPIISMLLSHGADVNLPLAILDESETRAVGSGALMEAARADSLQVAQLLLEKNAVDTDNRSLRLAVQRKAEGIVRELLTRLAFPDSEYRVNKRNVELGQVQIGESLLPSSLCPSKAVMLNWSCATLDCILSEWLTTACLRVNNRLRTTKLAWAAITRVDLSNNRLKLFPPLLWQMPSLRVLNLSSNDLSEVEAPSGYMYSTLIEVFILSHNNLSCLSAQLVNLLPSLCTLDISYNKLTLLPHTIWCCPSLKELNASHNDICCLPISTRRDDIPSFIHSSSAHNSFTSKSRCLLRKNMWQDEVVVSRLEDDQGQPIYSSSTLLTLNLSHNKLRLLPPCLACTCPRLQSLFLSSNTLTSLSTITSLPAHLKTLDVSQNMLCELFSPTVVMGGCGAEVLNVGGRKVSPPRQSRSRSKSAVRSQRALSVNRGEMGSEICCHRRHDSLSYLKNLNVSKNKLTSLVLSRGDHLLTPSLSSLDISCNEVNDLDGSILSRLSSLCVLCLSNNPLSSLPPQLGLLTRLWSLSLSGCPLNEPLSSIVTVENWKTMEVVAHLRCVLEESKSYSHLKLVILGCPGVGKSSIGDALRSEGSTQGRIIQGKTARLFNVKLTSKKSKGTPITFSVWDSNGQNELRPIHEMVICRRGVMIIVFRVTEGEASLSSLYLFLLSIHARAPNAAVVIVGTHSDQVPSSFLSDMEKCLRERLMVPDGDKIGLPRVVDVILLNGRNKSHIRHLINAILVAAEETKVGKENALTQQVPSSHIILLKILREISEERRKDAMEPVIHQRQIKDIIKGKMIKRIGRELRDDVELKSALSFIRDCGEILIIEDCSMNSLVVLDVLWLGDCLSWIVGLNGRSTGIIPLTSLSSIRQLSSIQSQLVSFLHKLNMAFLTHSHLLILPSLLPDEFSLRADYNTLRVEMEAKIPSVRLSSNSCTSFQLSITRVYSMAYIPTGFWPRLLSRLTCDETLGKSLGELIGGRGSDPTWILWQSGCELICNARRILVIKEYLALADPSEDEMHSMQYYTRIEGRWRPLQLSLARNILFLLPSIGKSDGEEIRIVTRVLSHMVDIVDCLLEDWFPSLGTRFVHSSQGDLLVKRIVMCPQCINPSIVGGKTMDDSHIHNQRQFNHDLRSKTLDGISQSTAPVVYTFSVEECMQASRMTHIRLECPSHGFLSLSSLCTDVAFLDISSSLVIGIDCIKKGRLLGRGAFGFVFRSHIKTSSNSQPLEVAVKMLEPSEPGPSERVSAHNEYKALVTKWQRDSLEYCTRAYLSCRQELSLLCRLSHSHTLSLMGVCLSPLGLVMEMAPLGALNSILVSYRKSGARIGLCTLGETCCQVAKALEYLHSNNIVYRDLKSENVLVWRFPAPFCVGEVHVKLGDYGISRVVQPSGGVKGYGGTEGFMAPEIVRWNGEEEYTTKVDIFSFGMFLFELITLKLPFESEEHVKERVLEGARPMLLPSELLWPCFVLDLLVSCWSPFPSRRPTSSQLVSFCSSPEFIHVLDAIVLPHSLPPSSIMSIPLDCEDEGDDAQIWMTTSDGIEVYTCTQFGWIQCTPLKMNTRPRYIGRDPSSHFVWCCSEIGETTIFSTSLTISSSFILPSPNKHLLMNAPLMYSHSLFILPTSFSLHLVLFSHDPSSPSKVAESFASPFEILSICLVNQPNNRQIWTGHGEGLITSHFISSDDRFSFSSSISHPEGNSLAVRHLLSCKDASLVWSALEGSSKVFCWDSCKRRVKCSLDTRKVQPASETIHTMQMDRSSHISTMCLLDAACPHLFVGTIDGTVLVLAASSLQPLSACRPFFSIHSLSIVTCRIEEDTQPSSTRTSSEGALGWMRERVERMRVSPSLSNMNNHLLLAIGSGFRSLTDRFITAREPNDELIAALLTVEDWSI